MHLHCFVILAAAVSSRALGQAAWPPPPPCQRMRESGRWVVLYGSFLVGAVNFRDLPVLFSYLEASLGLDAAALGAVLGFQGACHVVGVCCFGYLTSRSSSRLRLLAACASAWAVGTVLTAMSGSLWLLAAGRGLLGVSSGVVGPVSQCLVAEWVEPARRGRAFSRAVALDFLGQTFAAGGLAWLIQRAGGSWRLPLLLIALVTLIYAAFGSLTARALEEPRRARAAKAPTARADCLRVLRIPSMQVIILQGFLASTQKEANGFVCLWLQQCGFDATTAANLFSAMTFGNLLGSIFAGWAADSLAMRFRTSCARVTFGQIGNALRIPAIVFLFWVGPTQLWFPTFVSCAVCGFTQSLCYVGAVKPLCTEVVSPSLVGTAIALAATVDGAFAAAAGGPLVGWTAQLCGFRQGETTPDNLHALEMALGGMMLFTSIGTLLSFSLLYWTLQADQQQALAEAGMPVSDSRPERAPTQEVLPSSHLLPFTTPPARRKLSDWLDIAADETPWPKFAAVEEEPSEVDDFRTPLLQGPGGASWRPGPGRHLRAHSSDPMPYIVAGGGQLRQKLMELERGP